MELGEEFEAHCDSLISNDELDELQELLLMNKKQIDKQIARLVSIFIEQKDMKRLNAFEKERKHGEKEAMESFKDSIKELKEELKEEKIKEQQENEIFSQIPSITEELYAKVLSMPVHDYHSLIGNQHTICKNNLIYHFKFLDDGSIHKTTDYQNIRCRESTNNYIQMVLNKKTNHLSVLMPDQEYIKELPVKYIPVNILYIGKSVGHLCYLIIEDNVAFFFDPNGTSEPSNEFIDNCLSTILEDYKIRYTPIEEWREGNVSSMQLSKNYRELFNKGDCVIISLFFITELNKKERTPIKIIEDYLDLTELERKQLLNNKYNSYS